MRKGKQNLPQWINALAGLLLLVLGIMGYASPEWFFTQKYDVLMPSSQSKTILRVMMGFMATIGFLWVWAAFQLKDQARVLHATAFLTFGFILSRILGLFLDGFDQTFTYIELGFEMVALIVILVILGLLKSENDRNS